MLIPWLFIGICIMYVLCVFISLCICVLLGMLGRIALTGAMYRKLFDLSQETISKVTIGKLVNLMSYDVQRLDVVSCMLVVVLHIPILIFIPTAILHIPILIPTPKCTLYNIPFSFCSILPSYYNNLII